MNPHESTCKNIELYPTEFVERFGATNPHWCTESWIKRERSLCHDMVCILLANSEPNKNLEETMINNLKRKREEKELSTRKKPRQGSPKPSTSAQPENTGDEEDENFFDDIIDLDFEEVDFTESTFEETHHELTKYRYIVLEGLINAPSFQNHFTEKWEKPKPGKLFDIIDTKEELLIEVKTTVNARRAQQLFQEDLNAFEYAALLIVDMKTFEFIYMGKNDSMPGESKALNFLLKRKAFLKTLNIEDGEIEEDQLSEIIFKSPTIKAYLETMHYMCFDRISKSTAGDIPTGGFRIETIEKESLFELLIDPLTIESEQTTSWKGKITPIMLTEPILLEEESDKFAIEKFLSDDLEKAIVISGEPEPLRVLIELKKAWHTNLLTSKQFGFINLNGDEHKLIMDAGIKDVFGIGKKKLTYKEDLEDATQEEKTPLSKQKYGKWIENIIEGLSEKHQFTGFSSPIDNPETESNVQMYKEIQKWIAKFYREVSSRNVSVFMNQISNFYSRVSGAYNTTIGNKTTHSLIAAIPLKFNMHKDENVNRFMTGIAFRGPHHTRSPTDKINLFIVESVNNKIITTNNFYKKMTIIQTPEKTYLLRKTSIKKIDGIHLTFINNSLFMATNMIGDLILNHKKLTTEDDIYKLLSTYLNSERATNFFIDRVIDAVLMAAIGNSRDEGFFSIFRKLIMIGINERRGCSSFTFNMAGLCDKLNECISDNPFGMHFLISFRYALCYS